VELGFSFHVAWCLTDRTDTFTSLVVHAPITEFTVNKMADLPNDGLSN